MITNKLAMKFEPNQAQKAELERRLERASQLMEELKKELAAIQEMELEITTEIVKA